jgi:hypothetical protein
MFTLEIGVLQRFDPGAIDWYRVLTKCPILINHLRSLAAKAGQSSAERGPSGPTISLSPALTSAI